MVIDCLRCPRSAWMPGLSHRFVDERLAKALSHRLRVQILQRLEEAGEASPKELAEALGEPVGNVSYHVRILRELGCVELVRTEPRRGALAHFYRASVSPWLDDEQWARLPAGFRRETLNRTLSEIVEQLATASREGGFDGPEAHVSRVVFTVDSEGLTQITALLDETLEAVRRIAAEGARGRAKGGRQASRMIATEVAVIYLRPDSS
jgi:DNA-binding transcriptional ArsR family regulator